MSYKIKIQQVKTNTQALNILEGRNMSSFLKTNKGYLESIVCSFTNNKKYKGAMLYDYDDLYQIACEYLIVAIQNYDDSRGASLSTYAQTVIWNGVCQAIFKYNKLRDNEISFESLKPTDSDSSEKGEYFETAMESYSSTTYLSEFEDAIVDKLAFYETIDKLAPLHKKICKLRLEGYGLDMIAKKLNIKMSQLKTIYFRIFIHEFKDCRNLI